MKLEIITNDKMLQELLLPEPGSKNTMAQPIPISDNISLTFSSTTVTMNGLEYIVTFVISVASGVTSAVIASEIRDWITKKKKLPEKVKNQINVDIVHSGANKTIIKLTIAE
jgi:hypothetical protein